MNPAARDLPIQPLRPGALPPRAPRGFVRRRIRGVSHLGKRGHDQALCGAALTSETARPTAVCLTCAALIAELSRPAGDLARGGGLGPIG